MPAPRKYPKRRPTQNANKNELKVARQESDERQKARAGTLRDRFPGVRSLQVAYRMETVSGAVLEQSSKTVNADQSLFVDVACQGGCGNGLFLLSEALERMLQGLEESKEGLGLCQAASYQDPKIPCGTKLYYHITVER